MPAGAIGSVNGGRGEKILAQFRAIVKEKDGMYAVLQREDIYIGRRFVLIGEKVSRKRMTPVTPEQAAKDFMKGAMIHVQRMGLSIGICPPIGLAGTPAAYTIGKPFPIFNESDLAWMAREASA